MLYQMLLGFILILREVGMQAAMEICCTFTFHRLHLIFHVFILRPILTHHLQHPQNWIIVIALLKSLKSTTTAFKIRGHFYEV